MVLAYLSRGSLIPYRYHYINELIPLRGFTNIPGVTLWSLTCLDQGVCSQCHYPLPRAQENSQRSEPPKSLILVHCLVFIGHILSVYLIIFHSGQSFIILHKQCQKEQCLFLGFGTMKCISCTLTVLPAFKSKANL